jgi:hypothetical protein
MSRDLHLFDTSNYIFGGDVNNATVVRGIVKDQGVFRPREMPVGGINFLLNTINEFNPDNNDLVYVFDSTSDYKYDLFSKVLPNYGGYKGTRQRTPLSVVWQRKMSYDIIKHLGLNAMKMEGYEADDIIHTLVMMYRDSYNRIYVHTRDGDLTYLVRNNVEITTVGNQGKRISMQNYEEGINKNFLIPYNTIWLHKFSEGDNSDNIPRMPQRVMDALMREIPKAHYPFLGELKYVRAYVEKVAPDDEVAQAICNLMLPRDISGKDQFDLELVEQNFNYKAYRFFCINFGNKYFKRNTLDVEYPQGDELIDNYLDQYNQEVNL